MKRTIESKRFQHYSPANPSLYRLAYFFIAPPVRGIFNLHAVNVDQIPRRGPALLLINHMNLFDPIWVSAVTTRPIHYVVTENVFRSSVLAFLLRFLGCFPTRKASNDTTAIRTMMRFLKQGLVVGIYPEGIRTWDGLISPMSPTIASLIRMSKVPVVCCRLEGAYFALPRWANRYRRIPVRAVFERLYEADGIPSDKTRILKDVSSFLDSGEFGLKYNEKRYRSTGLASNITTLLYRCSNCGTMEGLKLVKPLRRNLVRCACCSSTWRITLNGRAVPLDENGSPLPGTETWAEFYRRISALPLLPIRTSRELALDTGEALYLASGPLLLQKEGRFPVIQPVGSGQLYLTDRRLLFVGSQKRYLDIPLGGIDQVATDPRGQFYFSYQNVRYLIIIRTESILKWYDCIKRLKESPEDDPAALRAGTDSLS